MSDPIEVIVRQLRQDPAVMRTQFTSSFLNNVAQVLDRDGFGAAKVFLLDRMTREETRTQAEAILTAVIPKLEAVQMVVQRRSLGSYIIKTLQTLGSQEIDL